MAGLPERFWKKVDKSDPQGCWLWTAGKQGGYGLFGVRGRARLAHRVAYESLVGPIPDKLTLDHLCRVRNCVNPAHLEPCTIAENSRRSPLTLVGLNAVKTQCPQGHPYDAVDRRGDRYCKTCHNRRNREWRARVRPEPTAVRG